MLQNCGASATTLYTRNGGVSRSTSQPCTRLRTPALVPRRQGHQGEYFWIWRANSMNLRSESRRAMTDLFRIVSELPRSE